jgi:hypothetical protein
MNDPSEEKNPQNARQNKLDQGHEEAALDELAETGDKETANGCQNIACAAGTGTIRHIFFLDHPRLKSKRARQPSVILSLSKDQFSWRGDLPVVW